MFIVKIAKRILLGGLTACATLSVVASCVEAERGVDVPPMGVEGTLFANPADMQAFKHFTAVCDGMQPYTATDTLNELPYHSLYRQQLSCKKSYKNDVCPTWVLNRATDTCTGPILLSETASGAQGLIEPRRLSDGKMSQTAFLFYTGVGQGEAFLLESERAFALVE